MPITSTHGERFWAIGLACPMYYDSATERLLVTRSGMFLMDDAAHEWLEVPFSGYLTSQTIGYVEKHGRRTESGVACAQTA
jgi:hypothetical protein